MSDTADSRRNDGRRARAACAGLAAGVLATLAPAAASHAQGGPPQDHAMFGSAPPPTFPTALDREALLGWIHRETDILPERVVAVTPQALTALVSTFPGGGGSAPRVIIRAEALNAETYARTGALSWHVSLTADCAGRRVKLGDTTGYPERNLLGERKVLRPAETDWRTPDPGTALDSALRAACDTGFKGPFADEAKASAQAAPVPAAAPPPPAPPRAPVASSRAAVAPTAPAPRAAAPQAAPRASLSVQVGAYASQAEGQAALGKLPQDRPRSLEQATVGGRTWYRLVVWGFASAQDAQRYCEQRKAGGGACFVRPPDKG